jgi:hypothetical protein
MRNVAPLDAITPADEPRSGVQTSKCPDHTDWMRANLADVLPDLTSPQVLDAFEALLNLAERQYLGKLLAPEDELGPVAKSFCGRLYFNLSQLRRVCRLGGVPPALMIRALGHPGTISAADEVLAGPAFGQLSYAPDAIRILGRHLRAAHVVREHELTTGRYLNRLAGSDPRRLSDFEVWSVVEQWLAEAPAYMQTVLLLGNALFHEVPVRKICERVGFPFEQLVHPQLAAGERSVSAHQAFDLVALADVARRAPSVVRFLSDRTQNLSDMRLALRETAFLARFEQFLERYGHRGRYEYDWALPRYREDPTPLLDALRAHVQNGSESGARATIARQARESAEAWRAFEKRLPPWRRWMTLPRVRRSIRTIKQYDVWREQAQSDVARVLGALRRWHLALAERFVERGWLDTRDDYFFLQLREIAPIVNGQGRSDTLRAIVANRIAERDRHRSVHLPLLMRASEVPALIRTSGVTGGSTGERTWIGHAVSSGYVRQEQSDNVPRRSLV